MAESERFITCRSRGTTVKTMTRGQKIHDWIVSQWAAGRTVYASTYLKTIKLAPKHAQLVRVKGEHCGIAARYSPRDVPAYVAARLHRGGP